LARYASSFGWLPQSAPLATELREPFRGIFGMKHITLTAVLFLLPFCDAAFAQPCFTPQACRQIREQAEAQQAAIAAQQQAAQDRARADLERRLAAQREEQRRIEAQQAERRRTEAQQVALAAQQAEQRRLNEQRQREAAFADVQKMPELVAFFGRPTADLIFLYNPSSRRIIRGLDGSLSAPTVRPVICVFFPTTDPSRAGFLNYATAKLEKLINTRFEFRQCQTLDGADVILFTTADLSIANLDFARNLGDAIKTGRLAGLLEVRQDDYDAKVIADKRRQDEMAVRARQLAAEIEQGIDDGSRQGVGILRMTAGASMCLVDVDQNILLTALTARNDGVQDWSGRSMRSYTPSQAFIAIKTGECPIVAGGAKSLRLIRDGLRRDSVDAGSAITWIDPAALDAAAAALAEERAEKTHRQAVDDAAVQAAAAEQRRVQLAAERAAAAACSADWTQCSDYSRVCERDDLIRQARSLLEEASSPLFGQIKVLKMWNNRANPNAAPKNQCMASMMTSRGEMTAFYGWSRVQGETFIAARAEF
jgi:hypothetical protein